MKTVVKLSSLLPGLAGICLIAVPAHADTLQNWRFDAQQNRLEFSTDQGVQPTAQLIANPTRIVVDLPGIRLKRPKINQAIGNAVQAVRIAQFDAQTTRVVIELAPGYTVEPQQIKIRGTSPTQWSVQLPALQSVPQPTTPNPTQPRQIETPAQPITPVAPPADTFGGLIPAGRSLTWLQQRIAGLRSGGYAKLKPALFVLDLETGNYLDVGADKVFPTASIIKLPILIAFFQDVDTGKIRLDETLVMTRDTIVGGSGEMQDLPMNSKFSALQTVSNMIITSDNTATNMIIKRMGGIQVLNQRFRSWGLEKTAMRNWLPDLKGTNTTTPRELVRLMALLDKQKLLSSASQARALDIMRRVRNRSLLPAGLGRGATIAHKTGDIGFMLGDAGIIVMPGGKRYLAAVLVESAYNDPAARDYVQDVSRIVYSYLSSPATAMLPSR
jgi:beta-lactamase class A